MFRGKYFIDLYFVGALALIYIFCYHVHEIKEFTPYLIEN